MTVLRQSSEAVVFHRAADTAGCVAGAYRVGKFDKYRAGRCQVRGDVVFFMRQTRVKGRALFPDV